MNKMNLALTTAITAAAVLLSVNTWAANSTKALQLQWQGVVPATPSVTGDWKFVDPLTGMDFVPVMGSLNITGGDIKSVNATPIQIGLKANTGTFTPSTNIKAYLAVQPTYVGLTGTTVPSAHSISVNGTPLSVGASSAINVGMVGGTTTAADIIPLTVTGSGQLDLTSYTAGDSVTLVANLMVTADVT